MRIASLRRRAAATAIDSVPLIALALGPVAARESRAGWLLRAFERRPGDRPTHGTVVIVER